MYATFISIPINAHSFHERAAHMNRSLKFATLSLIAFSNIGAGSVLETTPLQQFEQATGVSVSTMIANTQMIADSTLLVDDSSPWVIALGQTHKPANESVVISTQIEIEKAIINLSNSGRLRSVYSEDIYAHNRELIRDVQRYCQKKEPPGFLLEKYGTSRLVKVISDYADSRTEQNANTLRFELGAVWKLTCDGVITVRPAESQDLHQRALEVEVRVTSIRARLRDQMLTIVNAMTDAEYRQFEQDKKKPRVGIVTDSSSDFASLAENITHPELRSLILSSVEEIRRIERPIILAREEFALRNVKEGGDGSVLVYGKAHQFDEASRVTHTNVILVRNVTTHT